ncbi:cysteine proteinase inhibitor 1-like [Salvia hispanica]|uniref:cysteine proteinase inhibitor 1-like n=1 Tax=Salvia hispanica TaxID=49212 RepID=UPI0020093651|nr:cysteine proteinase inhibitor 1-like [Salvia hispanica]
MAPKSLHILLAALSLMAVALVPISAASRGHIVGGWKPIDNPNAPEIVEIAKFAISEYNKQKKTALDLVSVVKGESQVVAGINYRLVISAKAPPPPRPRPIPPSFTPSLGRSPLSSLPSRKLKTDRRF